MAIVAAPSSGRYSERELVSVGEAQRIYGVGANTLREWTNRGEVESVRLGNSGWRRISVASLRLKLGLVSATERDSVDERKKQGQCSLVVCYHRKSSGTKADLEGGIEELRAFCGSNYGNPNPAIYSDLASHINFDGRAAFNKLVDRVLGGELSGGKVVMLYKDRLSRLPIHAFFERICRTFNVSVVYVHDELDSNIDAVNEAMQDLLAFSHTVSCKIYSKRAAEKKTVRVDADTLKVIFRHIEEGYSIAQVESALRYKGRKGTNGAGEAKPITRMVLLRILREHNMLATVSVSGGTINRAGVIGDFLASRVRRSTNCKVAARELYATYVAWCHETNNAALSFVGLNKALRSAGLKAKSVRTQEGTCWGWVNVSLKS